MGMLYFLKFLHIYEYMKTMVEGQCMSVKSREIERRVKEVKKFQKR
jgi:hypothetical protein